MAKSISNYIRLEKKSGLKLGDKVRVKRKCKSYVRGWFNTWEKEMNKAIGKEGTITRIDKDSGGISIDFDDLIDTKLNGLYFPCFVLEKINS